MDLKLRGILKNKNQYSNSNVHTKEEKEDYISSPTGLC
jgi:hypothetical protein